MIALDNSCNPIVPATITPTVTELTVTDSITTVSFDSSTSTGVSSTDSVAVQIN